MTVGRRRGIRFGLSVVSIVGLLTTAAVVAPARSKDDVVHVVLDRAKLVPLPERIATLVIGNPLIVDAALQPGGQMVLTGKSFGTTNVLALDHKGKVLMQKLVRVAAPEGTVVVYRGAAQHTYSCAPRCEPQIALGDAEASFTLNLGQSVQRNTQAQGAARQQ